jgi:hypothetical protein
MPSPLPWGGAPSAISTLPPWRKPSRNFYKPPPLNHLGTTGYAGNSHVTLTYRELPPAIPAHLGTPEMPSPLCFPSMAILGRWEGLGVILRPLGILWATSTNPTLHSLWHLGTLEDSSDISREPAKRL